MTPEPLTKSVSDSLFSLIDDEATESSSTSSSTALLDLTQSDTTADFPKPLRRAEPDQKRRRRRTRGENAVEETGTPNLFDETLSDLLLSLFDGTVAEEPNPEIQETSSLGYEREWSYFVGRLISEDFEYGKVSESEAILDRLIKRFPLEIRRDLNRLYVENFYKDPSVLRQILHVISRVFDEELWDLFHVICLASFTQKDSIEIKDLAVRCFESWGTPQCLETLQGVHTETEWLQAYIDAVIVDLKTQYGVLR